MANILVLIPLNPKLLPALQERCKFLAEQLVGANPEHQLEIVFDSRGPGRTIEAFEEFNEKIIVSLRQELINDYLKPYHDYVFWVDADVVAYPADLPSILIKRNPNGISAPMIFYEGHGQRFYDTHGFIERGQKANLYPPFFSQPGPVFDLDSVGCVYLVPAKIYRLGGRYERTPGLTEHYSVCDFARKNNIPVRAYNDLAAIHSCLDLWETGDGTNEMVDKLDIADRRVKILERVLAEKDAILTNQALQLRSMKKSLTWQTLMTADRLIISPFKKIFDKPRKLLDVVVRFPQCVCKNPALAKIFFKILFRHGPYSALQNSYDFLQLQDTQNKEAKLNQIETECPADAYNLFVKNREEQLLTSENCLSEEKNLRARPLISIIVPVCDIDTKIFVACIESVRRQLYSNWELCIANSSHKIGLVRLLNKYQEIDSRIKVKHLKHNQGISGNSNEALGLASGDFVVLLDYDDELSPDALLEVAKAINSNEDVDLIYSDEDKIDFVGNYCKPFFKPDWNPDLLLSINYISHLSVFRRRLVEKVGGFRPDFDGSQDYDLVLRVTEKAKNIYHIPKVLYHWRMAVWSTSYSVEAKPYSFEKFVSALNEAIKRRSLKAKIRRGNGYVLNLEYCLDEKPLVSIIIPTKDKVGLLKKCVESILEKTSYPNYEIIIVDNNSHEAETNNYYNELEKNDFGKIKIIKFNHPYNYSAINNFATKSASGDLYLFLNNDTEVVSRDWLEILVGHALRPEVGVVGCKLLYPNDTIQHAGVVFGTDNKVTHAFWREPEEKTYFSLTDFTRNYGAVTGACLMIRKEVFLEVGGFDEKYIVPFSDIELCLQVREKKYLIVYTPLAKLYHLESATRGLELHDHDYNLFVERWGRLIDQPDPYYNPNLSKNPDKTFTWRGY